MATPGVDYGKFHVEGVSDVLINVATPGSLGLMSAADKTKLDSLSPTSTNVAFTGGGFSYSLGALAGTDATDLLMTTVTSSDPVSWLAWYGAFPNVGDAARPDKVFRMGWNIGGGGGNAVAGETALSDEWENYYAPDALHHYMERHIAYVTAAGTVYRPLSMRIQRDNDHIDQLYQGDTLSLIGKDGLTYFNFNTEPGVNTLFQLQNSSYIRSFDNNVGLLQQMRTDGVFVKLIRLNASNEVALAPDADADVRIAGANLLINGNIVNKKAANESTTVGVAGGAAALPATPLGYLTITLNGGGTAKIPYYNP